MSQSGSRVLTGLLVVALAWGALLRFEGITHTRLLLCDESFYLLEARRIVGQYRACKRIYEIFRRDRPKGLIQLTPADRTEVEALANQGCGQLGGRFGHDFLLALALGLGLPEEWAGQLVAAIFGTATLLVVAVFCWTRWGPRVSILASVALAGSIMHLSYSRSTLCESDCVFFVLVAVLLYAHTRKLWIIALSGLSFGAAFVCNVRALPVAYALVVFEILELSPGTSLQRLAVFSAAAAVPLVVAEALYHVVFLFSGATGVILTRQTYVHTILWQFTRLQGGVMEPGANLGLYPAYVVAVENPVLLALYAVGAGYLLRRACRRDNFAERLLAVVVLVVGAYWEFAVGIKCLRYVLTLVPLLAIGAGLALERWGDRATAVVALMLVAGCSVGWNRWRGELPGYRESAEWLAQQGAPKIVATQANYYRLHFPTSDVELPTTLEALHDAHKRGFRWYVDCYQKYHWPILPELLKIRDELTKRAKPREFAHPRAATPWTWFEGGHASVPAEWQADAGTIKVWDLNAVFDRLPATR